MGFHLVPPNDIRRALSFPQQPRRYKNQPDHPTGLTQLTSLLTPKAFNSLASRDAAIRVSDDNNLFPRVGQLLQNLSDSKNNGLVGSKRRGGAGTG